MGTTISKENTLVAAGAATFGAGAAFFLIGGTTTSSNGQEVNRKTVLNPGRYDGATFLDGCPQANDQSSWFVVPVKGTTYEPKKVLISAPYLAPHIDRFKPILHAWNIHVETIFDIERMEADMIIDMSKKTKFDGVICGDDRYTPEAFAACAPELKIVSKWGTGIDSINLKAAAANNVLVGNTENAFSKPVSDSIISYCLQFCRMQLWSDRMMKRGQWLKIPGRSLNECTIGVIGLGNVGMSTVKRAFGFECTIIGTDLPSVLKSTKCQKFCSKYNVKQMNIDELCKESDFVCVCAQLTGAHQSDFPTFHLINAKRLASMKKNAVLINCARGPIVDEIALIHALNTKQIAGAALDVFENEPLPKDSPLCNMDNVLMAPHNSNSSPTAHEAVHWSTLKNLLTGLKLPFDEQRTILAESKIR